MTNDVIVLIPAYEPTSVLARLVESIRSIASLPIVVVNDGSSSNAESVFAEMESMGNVEIVAHATNMGKGQALKTGINYILTHYKDVKGIVTADADGQHLVGDIVNIAKELSQFPKSLVLGVRDFTEGVPIRSRIGNLVTRKAFQLFMGCPVADTQTGLRGVPKTLAEGSLSIDSRGYEYEFEVLVMACNTGISIRQVSIDTVYLNDNSGSHFSPVIDSLKIYFVFFRFFTSSILVSVIDFIAFWVAFYTSSELLMSMIVGRVCAGLSQFMLSRHFVFNSQYGIAWEFAKYVTLVSMLMMVSFHLIKIATELGGNPYLAKILVETFLFITSFVIQKTLVFRQDG